MAIAQRARQRTAPHVAVALAAIERTHLLIRPHPIPVQGIAVVVELAAPAQFLAAADLVGRHQVHL